MSSNNTVTPLFPMENKKEKESVVFEDYDSNVDEYVKKIVKPIFEIELAKEADKNQTSVGLARFDNNVFALYQPHNYRVYFDFQKLGFRPPKTDVQSSVFSTYKLKNSSEHFFKDFMECSVTVKKYSIEVINHIEHKRWYRLEINNSENLENQIKDIIIKKNDECVKVLREFIRIFGGTSGLRILNRKSEDKVTFEDSINKIPDKFTFDSRNVKKVYMERNVEFKNTVSAVNYLENRAFEKVAPEIANELHKQNERLNIFEQNLNKVSEALLSITLETKNMAYNASSHIALVKEAKDAIQNLSLEVSKLNKSDDILIDKEARRLKARKLLKECGW